jgi:hypothetical protein
MLHQKNFFYVFFFVNRMVVFFQDGASKNCAGKATNATTSITIEKQVILLYTSSPPQGMSSIF